MSESSPELLRLVLDGLQEGVVILDAQGRVRDGNPAAESIFGIAAGTLRGKPIAEVCASAYDMHGRELPWEELPAAKALRGEKVSDAVISYRRLDGTMVWVECKAGPLTDHDTGEPAGAIITFHDVTYRLERERRFRHEADHDHLTGLANRRLLERTLDATVARAQHNERGVAVLLIDLDGFKAINDRYGHAVGDEVLREVAGRLRHNLRERDLVARFGGDEFVLVLADLRRPEEIAAAFAERVLEALARPITVDGRRLDVTASIGTACHPGDGRDAASLLTVADHAMYRVKSP